MGTGKTLESLVAFLILKNKNPELKLLVVSYKSSIVQWELEIAKFSDTLTTEVISADYLSLGQRADIWAGDFNKDVLIINYDLVTLDWVRNDMAYCLSNLIDKHKWVCILDEIHALKSLKAERHHKLRDLSRPKRINTVWGLTASPVSSLPEDLYGIVAIIRPDIFKNYKSFKDNYCIVKRINIGGGILVDQIVGYKNLERLQMLLGNILLNRKISDLRQYCDVTMPEIIYRDETIETPQGLLDLQRDVLLKSMNNSLQKIQAAQRLFSEPPPEYLGVIDLKYERLKQLLRDIVNGGDKVLVYSNYRYTIDILIERLRREEGFGKDILRFTGTENFAERAKALELFAKDEDYKIILVNNAGSNSLNFQTASYVIFIDLPLSYGQYMQTVGRVARLFSRKPQVTIINLTYKDSIEEWKLKLIQRKRDLTEKILGKQEIPVEVYREESLKDDLKKYMRGIKRV